MKLTADAREVYIFASELSDQEYMVLRSTGAWKWNRTKKRLEARITQDLLEHLALTVQLPEWAEAIRARLKLRDEEMARLRSEEHPTPVRPFPVRASLYEHQVRGANMALANMLNEKRGGFGFLYEMGTGKTLTALAVIGAMYQAGKLTKVLVVSPSSVCEVWEREMQAQATFPFRCTVLLGTKAQRYRALQELKIYDGEVGGPLQMVVVNYEGLWRDYIYPELTNWNPDMVIADESQRIKAHDATQSIAMHKLGDLARYKMILSGTPVQNSAIDLYSQYRFLDPTVFGSNFYGFRGRYARMGGFGGKQIIGYQNVDELVRKAYSIAYRVTKAEALDLPEQTFENRYIRLEPETEKLYHQLRREAVLELENGDTVTTSSVLTKLLRLQQVTGGFLPTDGAEEPTQISGAKMAALLEIAEDLKAAGEKLVVFARFTAEIDLIRKTFEKQRIKTLVLDGRTPMKDRGELIARFQGSREPLVFLAQIQTAGLGITLHAASVAVFYSLDFNYSNYSQALARIHRIGQRRPVTYIHLLAARTVDEKVMAALDAKQNLADEIINNWRVYLSE